ncbi:MAG TPA: ureidoglycolate hydrolase [Sneathiellales bacterium]|jgi:ureidoglycolate lyase|nr:ureidoglycolate hydrolase [Sneathiellales bacterium]
MARPQSDSSLAESKLERRVLTLEPATAEALAPFGDILGSAGGVEFGAAGFYDGKVQTCNPTKFVSDDDTALTLAKIDRRPFEVRFLEQHFKHTQSFIPLGGKPFVVVMAPPTHTDLPDIDTVRAFLFDGSAGFNMKIGTWHEFPFAVEDGTEVIVILRNETNRDLRKVEGGEAHGADVDKKNIQNRFGIVFEVDI